MTSQVANQKKCVICVSFILKGTSCQYDCGLDCVKKEASHTDIFQLLVC